MNGPAESSRHVAKVIFLKLKKLLRPGELRTDEASGKKYCGRQMVRHVLAEAVALPAQHGRCFQNSAFATKNKIRDAAGSGYGYSWVRAGAAAASCSRSNGMKAHQGNSAPMIVAVVQPR